MDSSPNSAPPLTRRLRALLHTGPLHELKRRWRRGPESLRHYDPLALASRAMDAVVDRSGLEEEADPEEVLRALTPMLLAMDQAAGVATSASRHKAAVERVLVGLLNSEAQGQPFEEEYTDLEGEVATRRRLEFRLMSEAHQPSGRVGLRLSNEAVNLTLRLLDLDIEDAQAAAEAVVTSQLERGRFEQALQSARQARVQSLRFQQKLALVARETRRDVDRLDWRGEVPTLISEALSHLARRLEGEQGILNAAEERLDLLEDPAARLAVARVGELIRECRVRHVELHEELMRLRGTFLDAQAQQSFLPEEVTPLPDLRQEVLEPILSLGRDSALGLVERSVPALMGPVLPGLTRLTTLTGWLLMPRRAVGRDTVPAPVVEAIAVAEPPPHFPPMVRRYVEGLLASLEEPVALSTLLGRARREGAGDDALELLVLSALQRFAPDQGPGQQHARRLSAPLEDPDFFGDDLELMEAPCAHP